MKPEIRILSGNYKEDRYEATVEIEIKQKQQNAEKTIYKIISGNKNGEYKEIKDTEKIKIEDDGIYKVIAYTYGKQGNKSKSESLIVVREEPTYTIKYMPGLQGKFDTQTTNKLHIGDKSNPSNYTVETGSFTLNNPIKIGYIFEGWTGSNGQVPQQELTIEQGTVGNKNFVANWIPSPDTVYKISVYTMNLNGEYEVETTNYTGTTEAEIVANTDAREGFKYEADLSTPRGNIKPDGTSELEVYYSRNSYTLNVTARTGGAASESIGSVTYGKSCTVVATANAGYTFEGWYEGDTKVSSNASFTFNMPAKNYMLTSNFTENTYTITYNLAGGSLASVITNPSSYKVTTNNITLNNPTRTGYTFTGWTLSGAGSITKTTPLATANQTYIYGPGAGTITANWTINTYTLTVKHYVENIDDTKYSFYETSTHQNIAYGTTVTLANYKKTITGANYSYASLTDSTSGGSAIETRTITGNTTVCLYYARNTYTLTAKHYLENTTDDNFTLSTTTTSTIKYGKTITLEDYKTTVINGLYSYASLTASTTGGATTTTTTITANKEIGIYYERPVYAVFYTDGTLSLSPNTNKISGKTVSADYGNIKSRIGQPWSAEKSNITTVTFLGEVLPRSTYGWFHQCNNLANIQNINNLNTTNVTDMTNMFFGCKNVTSLDLSNFDTTNVTNMMYMFTGCDNVTSLDVSKFDTTNVTSMSYMFDGCENITILDLSNFNTSKVTNMNCMFNACTKLTVIYVGSKWTTTNATTENMFSGCGTSSVTIK